MTYQTLILKFQSIKPSSLGQGYTLSVRVAGEQVLVHYNSRAELQPRSYGAQSPDHLSLGTVGEKFADFAGNNLEPLKIPQLRRGKDEIMA